MTEDIKLTATVHTNSLLGEVYRKYTHPSGLDIYIFPKKLSSSFALFGTKYGSVNNLLPANEGGFCAVPDGVAHFLEHKLFTSEDGSDAFDRFSALGADANAYTAFNRTAYYFVASSCFYESLCELVDFVTHPYFTDETVESEMGIISEEIAMYDDSPSERCLFGMLEGMYHIHPVRKNICGSAESIRRITPNTLYDCYGEYYRPDNMVLIVCGDVEDDRVLSVINEHLPEDFKGHLSQLPRPSEGEPREVLTDYREQTMQVSKPLFSLGLKDTDIPDTWKKRQKKEAVMTVLTEMIFSPSGKLYSRLIDKKLISPSLYYGYTMSKDFAYLSVSGEAEDPRAVRDELLCYVEECRAVGLGREDFDRAKRVMYADSVRMLDSVESIGNAMFSVICEDGEIFGQVESMSEVTFEEVSAAFEEFFRAPSLTLSVVSAEKLSGNEK